MMPTKRELMVMKGRNLFIETVHPLVSRKLQKLQHHEHVGEASTNDFLSENAIHIKYMHDAGLSMCRA